MYGCDHAPCARYNCTNLRLLVYITIKKLKKMRLGGYFFTFGAVSCPSDCREEHWWRQSFSHGFVSNKIDLGFACTKYLITSVTPWQNLQLGVAKSSSQIFQDISIWFDFRECFFAPQIAQMDTDVLPCHAFFLTQIWLRRAEGSL